MHVTNDSEGDVEELATAGMRLEAINVSTPNVVKTCDWLFKVYFPLPPEIRANTAVRRSFLIWIRIISCAIADLIEA